MILRKCAPFCFTSHYAQIPIKIKTVACASEAADPAQSDQSLWCALLVAETPNLLQADSEDLDHTGRIATLILRLRWAHRSLGWFCRALVQFPDSSLISPEINKTIKWRILEPNVINSHLHDSKLTWSGFTENMSRDMTNPTKWVCAQRRLRSAWASAESGQSLSLSAWRKLGSLATHWAHSEDSDQTVIWVFAGRKLILLVLSCRGSFMRDCNSYQRDRNPLLSHFSGGSVLTKNWDLVLRKSVNWANSVNPYLRSGPVHSYQLDDCISDLRGVWCTFSFVFYFE